MRTKLIIAAGVVLTLFGAFQNCSSGSMPDTSTASVASTNSELQGGQLYVFADPPSVAPGGLVTISSTMTSLTSVNYTCATATGAVVANGILSPNSTSFSLVVNASTACTFQGNGINLVMPVTQVLNIPVTTTVATPTAPTVIPVAAAPPQTWTWRGLVYQTTCNGGGICDGVEWASCAGTSCPAAGIQCYTASPRGQPGHPIGLVQYAQPTGYNCTFR